MSIYVVGKKGYRAWRTVKTKLMAREPKQFVLRSPIPRQYFSNRKYCQVNQLFGENLVSYYKSMGLLGHRGIDFKTTGVFKFLFHNLFGFLQKMRINDQRRDGEIPILAAHDGYIISQFNDNKTEGVFVKIESPEVKIGDVVCKVTSIYFHLSRVRRYKGDGTNNSWTKKYGEDFVKAGSVIGYAGNTGRYTTGAHVHFGIRVARKYENTFYVEFSNGYTGYEDPMPYFVDETVYQRGLFRPIYFYKGRQITKQEAKNKIFNF